MQTDTLLEGSCLTDPVRRVITCRRSRLSSEGVQPPFHDGLFDLASGSL